MVSASHQGSVPIAASGFSMKMRYWSGDRQIASRGPVSSTHHAPLVESADIDDLLPELIALRRDLHAHPGARLRGEAHRGYRRRRAARSRHRSSRRPRRHRRRRHAASWAQHADDRPARRHGRVADHRAIALRARQPACRCASWLRSRRPHRDAARCRTASCAHPPFRRNGPFHLSARGRRPRWRARDAGAGLVRAISV